MHKCELITKHTTGQVTRKLSKQVDDSFPEMELFRTKIRKFVTWIMDTNQKSKYKQYVNFVHALMSGKQPLKLETPNDTRVSHAIRMYHMLRSYWDLLYYMCSADTLQHLKNIYPMPNEWDTVRVLWLTHLLLMNLQTNTPAAVSTHLYLFVLCSQSYPVTVPI